MRTFSPSRTRQWRPLEGTRVSGGRGMGLPPAVEGRPTAGALDVEQMEHNRPLASATERPRQGLPDARPSVLPQKETLLIPLWKTLVPFHISTVKNVSKSEEGENIYLRFNFQIPSGGVPVRGRAGARAVGGGHLRIHCLPTRLAFDGLRVSCRTILATSVCQLRHNQMEQGLTEPHAGRSTFLLSYGGAGGGYYSVAFCYGADRY